MPKAKTIKKKITTKVKPKKVEKKVEEVLKVPKTEPDPSLWRENGFASEKAYRKFLQPNS
jgi:hypothetical protein